MNNPINVAITAFGMSGQVFHGPLLKVDTNFQVKKVFERTKKLSLEQFPDVDIVRSYNELLADKSVELIVVTSPDHTHYKLTKMALEAGKHVVVEKPFTIKPEEGEELIELAQKKGLVLSVFHNRRWDGDFLTVQKVIEQKLLGNLVEYKASWERYRNYIVSNTWKENPQGRVGCLHDLGSHLIDQAIVLFEMPKAVTAHLGIVRTGGQTIDHFELHLKYADVKVHLRCSYLVRDEGPRYLLNGTEGSFTKFGIDPQEDDLKNGYLPDGPGWGTEPTCEWGNLNSTVNGLHFNGNIETLPGDYTRFYANIYDAIREGKELAVKPQEALNVIKVVDAAIKSNAEERTIYL